MSITCNLTGIELRTGCYNMVTPNYKIFNVNNRVTDNRNEWTTCAVTLVRLLS
jgi:hypothetical protein